MKRLRERDRNGCSERLVPKLIERVCDGFVMRVFTMFVKNSLQTSMRTLLILNLQACARVYAVALTYRRLHRHCVPRRYPFNDDSVIHAGSSWPSLCFAVESILTQTSE